MSNLITPPLSVWVVSLVAGGLTISSTFADHPEAQARTTRIEQRLLRAEKWTTLRKLDLAVQELEYALGVDPESVPVWIQLAKTYLKKNQLKEAFASVEKALSLDLDPEERVEALALRGELYLIYKGYRFANDDFDQLFALMPEHARIEWYLQYAYSLRMCDRFETCEAKLHEGYEETSSLLLHSQWLEALMDVDEHGLALKLIEEQMPSYGNRSDWLVRRALVYRKLGDEIRLQADLEEALEEINARLEIERDNPDLTLLVNRAQAYLLLGERERAKEDYHEALAAGADDWMLWRLERGLKE